MGDKKRIRTENWDYEQKLSLAHFVKKHLSVVEDKSNDSIMVKKKNVAWFNIHSRFCATYGGMRSTQQLKEQWRRMKQSAKKTIASYTRYSDGTGDGSVPVAGQKEPTELDWMLSRMIPYEFMTDPSVYDISSADHAAANGTAGGELKSIADQTSQPEGSAAAVKRSHSDIGVEPRGFTPIPSSPSPIMFTGLSTALDVSTSVSQSDLPVCSSGGSNPTSSSSVFSSRSAEAESRTTPQDDGTVPEDADQENGNHIVIPLVPDESFVTNCAIPKARFIPKRLRPKSFVRRHWTDETEQMTSYEKAAYDLLKAKTNLQIEHNNKEHELKMDVLAMKKQAMMAKQMYYAAKYESIRSVSNNTSEY